MTSKNLAAYTPPTRQGAYPAYVNISQDGDVVIVTVRSETEDTKPYVTSHIRLPTAEAITILKQALSGLAGSIQ